MPEIWYLKIQISHPYRWFFLTFLLSLSLLQRENLKRDFPVPSLPLPFAKGELKRDFPVPSLPLPFAKGESKRD
jgi:hypothetical protein